MSADVLPRRLAAHPRFRWASGMVDVDGDHVIVAPSAKFPTVYCVAGGAEADEGPDGPPPSRWIGLGGASPLDLSHPATVGVLLADLMTAARAKFQVVEIENDWRTPHPEVRLVELHGDGRHVLVAFVEMPLGEAVACALLNVWGPA